MPPTTRLVAFTVTAFVLIVVPGPSVLFVVSRAIALGRAAGVATVAGNTAGAFAQVVAAGTARAWLAGSPRRLELLGGTGGLVMIGIGARLALTGRKD